MQLETLLKRVLEMMLMETAMEMMMTVMTLEMMRVTMTVMRLMSLIHLPLRGGNDVL
jgi:hypothetical protein